MSVDRVADTKVESCGSPSYSAELDEKVGVGGHQIDVRVWE